MSRTNLSHSLLICLCALLSLNACAQQHQRNDELLKNDYAILQQTVLLNNQSGQIPLQQLEKIKIAAVGLGYNFDLIADSLLNKYAKISPFHLSPSATPAALLQLEDDLKYYTTVIVSIDSRIGSQPLYKNFIHTLSGTKQVILALYGDPTVLNKYDQLDNPIIYCPDYSAASAALVPQLIFGGIPVNAKLSQTYSAKYTAGSGFSTRATRLKYTLPEDAGVHAADLQEIDQIAAEAIRAKAAPGMVVLVAKDGKVIFNKAYGQHTYGGLPEQTGDIFDVASVTKISATTPAVMHLVEENKLNLDTNVGAYIALARPGPMNNVKVRDVMLHQAGFIPYIAFHDGVKPTDHSSDSSAAFPTKVADGYYIRKDYFKEVMWPSMLNAPIRTPGKYVYSDISMYVMKDIVEHLSGEQLQDYTQENFYTPLGMQTAGFLPRNRFAPEKIVPTENDTYFRKILLTGYVHDQGAALVGGVSGHAGLFASANDLAILYQMLLNKGTYGSTQYFRPQTVEIFTSRQSGVSRRGLGFDRWDPDRAKKYPSASASPQTYGHTGYTGTAVWVDPARGLVYIFLSNRVHPAVTDKLVKMSIRSRIQEVINAAIDKQLHK